MLFGFISGGSCQRVVIVKYMQRYIKMEIFTCVNNVSIMHSSQASESGLQHNLSGCIGQVHLRKLKEIGLQKRIDEQFRTW